MHRAVLIATALLVVSCSPEGEQAGSANSCAANLYHLLDVMHFEGRALNEVALNSLRPGLSARVRLRRLP